jgi:site-specific recombinase XerD
VPVSRPAGQAPAAGAAAEQPAGPSGLLEKLVAAVRPEFRAGVLVFDPADPVFGGGLCLVDGCARSAHASGMCGGHLQRWNKAGRPDPGQLPEAVTAPWHGHAPLASGRCQVPAAARPDPRACLVSYCEMWADPGRAFCRVHRRRWRDAGRPDPAEFARACETPDDRERADLTSLPRQLKLELQYALQRRRDDNTTRTKPGDIRAVINALAASGAASLLMLDVQEWRSRVPDRADRSGQRAALLAYAHRQVTALADGQGGWDSEYPRDTWRLRRLGITGTRYATLRFGGISQPWLKDLARRWTRWRISTGQSMSSCYHGVRAVTRFSAFAAHASIQGLHQADRELLERYLASLHRELGGNSRALEESVGELSTFLLAICRHGWDASLPATAMFFPEDYPRKAGPLPRALAAHVMAQVEDPAKLDRWGNPAYRLITIILIRCGLRISSATTLPWDCIAYDADGAPYLRYWNTKMKREALVPIDEELCAMIGGQHDRNRERWPGGTPVLFPHPHSNIDGTRPVDSSTYRAALHRWLDDRFQGSGSVVICQE